MTRPAIGSLDWGEALNADLGQIETKAQTALTSLQAIARLTPVQMDTTAPVPAGNVGVTLDMGDFAGVKRGLVTGYITVSAADTQDLVLIRFQAVLGPSDTGNELVIPPGSATYSLVFGSEVMFNDFDGGCSFTVEDGHLMVFVPLVAASYEGFDALDVYGFGSAAVSRLLPDPS